MLSILIEQLLSERVFDRQENEFREDIEQLMETFNKRSSGDERNSSDDQRNSTVNGQKKDGMMEWTEWT